MQGTPNSFAASRQAVLEASQPLAAESVSVREAAGRVAAEPVSAAADDPPAPRSAMDGYALRAADTATAAPGSPAMFSCSEVVGAGHAATGAVSPGVAIRIMTGAPLPAGADAVVKQEDTAREGEGRFTVRQPLAPGENVVPRGARVGAGDMLLPAGEVVGAGGRGLLASLGRTRLAVHRRPRVALLAIGDELVEPGTPLAPGQLYMSNLYVVETLAARYGCEPRSLGIAKDDPGLIARLLEPRLIPAGGAGESPLGCEAVITLGGSHHGDFDFVATVFEGLGATLQFRRTRMAPGGSMVFGVCGRTLLFGLPGTPIAAWVAFETLVRPALWRLAGRRTLEHPLVPAVLAAPLQPARGRTGFVPVRLSFAPPALPRAIPLAERTSGGEPPALLADGLVQYGEDSPDLPAGAAVAVALFGRA